MKKAKRVPASVNSGKRATKKPPMRSPRVAAWLYGVINPLIESLEREQTLLAAGNLTWRAYSQRPEFILPPAEYLDPNGQTNLLDLTRYYPDIGKRLQQHSAMLSEAVATATVAHQRLMNDPPFKATISGVASKHRDAGGQLGHYVSGESIERILAHAGERSVNAIEALASHYIDSEFWRAAWPEARVVAARHVGDVRASIARLRDDSAELLQFLRDVRTEICDEYDLPPAPSP